MFQLISFFLICFTSLFAAPHLMIHMDINRTIIASDVTQGLGLDDIVNLSLAKKYLWSWEEGLKPMSYYDYIYTVKYPGARKDQALRKVRRTAIHGFIDYLEKSGHPYAEKAVQALADASKVMESCFIFPSFFKLLAMLEEEQYSYTLVFRTFGTDLDRVMQELGWVIPTAIYAQGRLHTEKGVLETPAEAFAYFKECKWVGVRDDYFYWNENNELSAYGKQFPLQLGGNDISFFFDDNIELDSEVNIVAPIDVTKKIALQILPLIEQGVLIPVITIDAILDEDYFVRFIRKKLQEHSSLHFSFAYVQKSKLQIPSLRND